MRSFLLSFINDSVVLAASLVMIGITALGAYSGGFVGFFLGLLSASLFCALFFGLLLALLEINENTKRVRELLEQRLLEPDDSSATSLENEAPNVLPVSTFDMSTLSDDQIQELIDTDKIVTVERYTKLTGDSQDVVERQVASSELQECRHRGILYVIAPGQD